MRTTALITATAGAAIYPMNDRATVEAQPPPPAPPVTRSQTPTGAGGCPTTAPAGSTSKRRAR